MYSHGLAAVDAADATDSVSLQALARVSRSWAGVVVDPAQAMTDLETAIEMAASVGDDETELMAVGYRCFNLAMSFRFDEALEIATPALTANLHRKSYPLRVVSQSLICGLVVDDPQRAYDIDERTRTHNSFDTMWGTRVIRAAVQASLGNWRTAADAIGQVEEFTTRAGVNALPDLLLVPAVMAHRHGDADRAARYLGAIRSSEVPTQSLMVSMSYRSLRNHVRPDAPNSDSPSTSEVWRDAVEWMAEVAG